MARAKKKSSEWDDMDAALAHILAQEDAMAVKHNAKKPGHVGYIDAARAAVSDIGPRLPFLSLRYLFQRSTLPFERTILIFGTPGSCKSALLCWIYGLVYQHKGRYLHIETEDKDNAVMRLSFTEYDERAGKSHDCPAMDDFQQTFKQHLDWLKGECAKAKMGRLIPWVYGVDSLVAKLTADAAVKMDKRDGASSRRYSDESRSLSDWFKYAPTHLRGWPFLLAAVNHDKPSKDDIGRVVHHRPGGYAPDFYATFRVLAQKIKDYPMTSDGWEGKRVFLSMDKNSLAADKMSVSVDFRWRVRSVVSRAGTQTEKQDSAWMWAKATTEMLYNLIGGDDPKKKNKYGARGDAVREILGLRKVTGGKYVSDTLNVTADDPLSPHDMGMLIENSPHVLAALEPRLGIHACREYKTGVDFADQVAAARAAVDEFMPSREALLSEGEVSPDLAVDAEADPDE